MTDFDLQTLATLKNINPRKEGPKDDKILALDLKFQATCPGEVATDVLGDEQYSRIRDFLWKHTEDGMIHPRFSKLGHLKCERELAQMNVAVGGLWFAGAKVYKFEIAPRDQEQIDLTFHVSAVDPPSNALPILADCLDSDLQVAIEPAQQALDLDGRDGSAA